MSQIPNTPEDFSCVYLEEERGEPVCSASSPGGARKCRQCPCTRLPDDFCPRCYGEGKLYFNMDGSGDAKDSDEIETCPKCNGTGIVAPENPMQGQASKA